MTGAAIGSCGSAANINRQKTPVKSLRCRVSLENWLSRHEPVPLIVDDVLLKFDDDRAIASMQLLAELSRQTQVVFITHHQHLVEMATNNLSKEDLLVTTLSDGATGP